MIVTKEYIASGLAGFLHSFPHVDLSFQTVNNSFNLTSYEYKEALVFWAGVPVVWMLVTMLIIIMYFCYRCCQREVDKPAPCIKWAIGILALLSCSAVGAGFYGNEEAHKGLQHFIEAASDVQETINRTESELHALEQTLNSSVVGGIEDFRRVIETETMTDPTCRSGRGDISSVDRMSNESVSDDSGSNEIISTTNKTLGKVSLIRKNIKWIEKKANRVTFGDIYHYAIDYGFYRWLIMVLLLSWLMVTFVLLMFALIKATKCFLVVIGALCILSLIVCWTAAGFHLGISVAIGDFCTQPNAYFEGNTTDHDSRETIKYYITCNRSVNNPFMRAFLNTYAIVESANASVTKALNSTYFCIKDNAALEQILPHEKKIYAGINNAVQTLMHLNALVECTNLHKAFLDGFEGICHRGLPGLMFLIVSEFLTGLFFTGLVLVVAGSWRSFVDRRDKHMPKTYVDATEEDGPFLLQRDNSTPSYYSFLPGCRGVMNEQMQMQKHGSVNSPGETMMSPPGYNGSDGNHQNSGGGSNMARLNDASL